MGKKVAIELTDRQIDFLANNPNFNFQEWISVLLEKKISILGAIGQKVDIVIAAAGYEERINSIEREIPKVMLKIRGKSLLERQVELFKRLDISEIYVVRGYQKKQINFTEVKYVDNDEYRDSGIFYSFYLALKEMSNRMILSYGDIHFEEKIIKELLINMADFAIVVDRSWRDHYQNRTEHTICEAELVVVEDGAVKSVGTEINYESSYGEFIGLASFSKKGVEIVKKLCLEINKKESGEKDFQFLKKASLTDFLNKLIQNGERVVPVDINGGWLEIDTFEDYKESWSKIF